jgi:hypothetical protein
MAWFQVALSHEAAANSKAGQFNRRQSIYEPATIHRTAIPSTAIPRFQLGYFHPMQRIKALILSLDGVIQNEKNDAILNRQIGCQAQPQACFLFGTNRFTRLGALAGNPIILLSRCRERSVSQCKPKQIAH